MVEEKKLSERELERRLREAKEVIRKMVLKNSHELRSPICTLLSIIHFLEEKPKEGQEQELFKYLKTTVLQLDKVIHEINDCPIKSGYLD